MPYIVDVNDPAQPSNNKAVAQGAEELRAIKQKISSFTRAGDGKITWGFINDFSEVANFLAGLTGTTGAFSGNVTALQVKATDATPDAAEDLTRKDYVDSAVATALATALAASAAASTAASNAVFAGAVLNSQAPNIRGAKNLTLDSYTNGGGNGDTWILTCSEALTDLHKIQVTCTKSGGFIPDLEVDRIYLGDATKIRVKYNTYTGGNSGEGFDGTLDVVISKFGTLP